MFHKNVPNRRSSPKRIATIEAMEPRTLLSASLVKDVVTGSGASSPDQLTSSGNYVYFVASAKLSSPEVWRSDGTATGTIPLTNVSNNGGLGAYALTDVNGTLFFSDIDSTHGYELWKSNGTVAGTMMVKDIFPGGGDTGPDSSRPHSFVIFNNLLYFAADDGNGEQIWKSDGTPGGTTKVTSINPGGITSFSNLAVSGNTLYFAGDDGIHGPALWKSDGTGTGTSMVKAVGIISGADGVLNVTVARSLVYFLGFDNTNGFQIWRSDGTATGTHPTKIINPDPFNTDEGEAPSQLTAVGNILYFNLDDGTHGRELWRTDGSSAGTMMVKDLDPFSNGNPKYLVNFNGTLYFSGDDDVHGVDLFKSNGTAAGTILVKDIAGGMASSNPTGLTVVNGAIYFAANDDTRGFELWKSDGTPGGTAMVQDINVGSADGIETNSHALFAAAGGNLFFPADDGTHGLELWALKIATPPPPPGSIAGNVFNDTNGNGAKEVTEKGLIGVKVFIDANHNGLLDSTEKASVTDATGNYNFANLAAGSYRIAQVVPAGFKIDSPVAGYYDTTLTAGTNALARNFADKPVPLPASITGVVFNDTNGNGTKESTDKPLVGVKVFIDANHNGVLDSTEKSAATDSLGNYTFTNLAAGSYRIAEVVPTNFKIDSPAAGFYDVALVAGQNATAKNFADKPVPPPASVAGNVWNDANGNGIKDASEKGIASVRVYLDANKNAKFDATEKSVLTDSAGNYSITGLAAGTYRLAEVSPAGLRISSPSLGYSDITLIAGQNLAAKNFVNTARTLLSGVVFLDANGNKLRDTAEAGLAGWKITVDQIVSGSHVITTLTTQTDGSFSIGTLSAGTYTLKIVPQAKYLTTTPTAGTVILTLAAGKVSSSILFGEKKTA